MIALTDDFSHDDVLSPARADGYRVSPICTLSAYSRWAGLLGVEADPRGFRSTPVVTVP